MTRADRMLVAILACVALVVTPIARARAEFSHPGGTAVVECSTGTVRLPLSVEKSYRIPGLLGPVVVEVAHGSVRVRESGCKDHVCVRSGWISSPGEAIACVPNGISVVVEGEGRGLDAIVR